MERMDTQEKLDRLEINYDYLKEENEKLKKENRKLREKIKYIRKLNTYDYNELQDLVITLEEENRKLKEKVSELEDVSKDYDLLSKDFIVLGEENKKLKKYYDRDKEELMESCYSLAKENEKLKSDLGECECSMHFENDEVGYRKRECKKLKEEVRFLEECLDRKEKLNKEYRKEIDKYKKQYEHSLGEDDELIYEEGLYD